MTMEREEFFTVLLSSSMLMHMRHLQCQGPGSYAAHLALGEFYTTMPGLVDTVIESLQARTGKLEEYDYECTAWGSKLDPLEYLENLRDVIEGNRFEHISPDYSNIQDTIEDILTLIDSTIYKLNFLR